jgi:la-related protein 1
MAPLQTYNMYDYNMVQPMSAVPYNPYGVDQFALFSMITVQV